MSTLATFVDAATPGSGHEDATMMMMTSPRPRAPSDFDLRHMPHDRIVKRVLHPWSVHFSLRTGKYIATISRPEATIGESSSNKVKYLQFFFPTEREARKFCFSYAPPRLASESSCRLCATPNAAQHCRNCGVSICERCSIRWGSRMVPKTYLYHNHGQPVRVCKSCDWLSNAFCLALLQGRSEDAVAIHATGNVNLRNTFADIHCEAMFPIHCAVMGGALDLVQWLVDSQLCPISVTRDPKSNRSLSVQTSAGRTLLDLAMTGRPKLDILMFFIQKGLSIEDIKDPSLASKTLEIVMKAGGSPNGMIREINLIHHDDSVTTLDDACRLCCERSMDCVLQPCGHQICCSECGQQLQQCPTCKVPCSVLRIYRQ